MKTTLINSLVAMDIETTGLSPIESHVVSIAICSDEEFIVWESKNEKRMLDDFAYWLSSRDNGTIVTWNGAAFDWPFLFTRARTVGSKLANMITLTLSETRKPSYSPLDGHEGGYLVSAAGWDHIDVMCPWREIGKAEGHSYALKKVARLKGIEVVEVDRTRITELSKQELAAYNISDVDATLQLAVMLGEDQLFEWTDSLEMTVSL